MELGPSMVPTTRLPPPPPPPLPLGSAVLSSSSLLPPHAATSSAATVSTITHRRFLRRPMDPPAVGDRRPGDRGGATDHPALEQNRVQKANRGNRTLVRSRRRVGGRP